ncbi:MAG: TlpA family protein disulfide reductase [Anaerohalosphaeraceae bacterium]
MYKRNLQPLKIIIFSFVIALYAASNVDAADIGNDDALLKMLPGDCMFCVRVNNFNGSLGKLDAYMAGASPIPVSLAMLANLQLGSMIGDPMLTGIDQGGDFALFAIPPQANDAEPVVGLLVPVTDYKTFVETNSNCKEGEGGMAALLAPNSPVGGFALAEAGDGKYAIVVSESEKATLPPLKEAIANSQKPLGQQISAAQAKEAVSAPVWAYINLAKFYEKYNQNALSMFEMAQQEITKTGGSAEMMEFYFKMLPELFKEFAGEADSATIALTPQPTIMTLDVGLRARDGSDLAKMLVADPKPTGYTLTNYLDNSNAVNALMRMDPSSMQVFYDKLFDIMEAATEDPTAKEQTAKMKGLTQKMFDVMGDEVSVSYSYMAGTPPFKLQEVIQVKDSAAMKALMTESLEYVNSLYKTMGIPAELKYEPAVSTYKDATIDTMSISILASDDPNDTMQKEIEKMYGSDGHKYYLAQTQDKFYLAMGPNSEATLKTLIDKPTAAAAPSGDIKVALDALKDTPYKDFVCSVNVIKLMKGMGEMMQSMGDQADMGPVADMFSGLKDVQTQSCLVTGGAIADGQAALRLAVPKQHLVEIVGMAMQIQQQAMAMQQQTPPAGMTPQMDNSASPQAPTSAKEVTSSSLQSWIGKPAPELKMVDLEGNVHRVSRLKGKKVILDFWASWCPPCKKSIPDLIKLASSGNSDLVILGLSDEPAEKLTPFVKEKKMNYPVIAYEEKLSAPYGQVTAIPTLFLIDSEGVIRDVLTGYHEPEVLETKLKEIK